MTTAVATFTKTDMGSNTPTVMGNMRAVFGKLDITTYATGGYAVPDGTGGISKVYAVYPLSAICQNGAAVAFPRKHATSSNTVQLFAVGGTETTDNTDGGDLDLLILGT